MLGSRSMHQQSDTYTNTGIVIHFLLVLTDFESSSRTVCTCAEELVAGEVETYTLHTYRLRAAESTGLVRIQLELKSTEEPHWS